MLDLTNNVEKKTLNKYLYIFVLISLTSLFGCNKEIEFTFAGHIIDRAGVPVSNVQVQVFENAGTIQDDFKHLGTATTNSAGYYSISVPRKQVNSYKVEVNSTRHHTVSKEIIFDDLDTENENIVSLITHLKSWVKFTIVNTDPNKDVSLLKITGNETCPECCPDGYSFFYGVTDTVKICGADAGEYYKFGVQIPGISYEEDSVLCPDFDTIEYVINP